MDFQRGRFSSGEFLIPALAGSPRRASETGESVDLSCIADVFRIDDLSEFSNEDIGGPIPTKSVAVASTAFSEPSQAIARHGSSCSSFAEDFPFIDGGVKSACPTYEYEYEIGGLEWLSDFGEYSFAAVESSNSGGSFGGLSSVGDSEKQTVEEGAITESAAVNERSSLLEMVVPGRPRSKRARVAAVPVWSYGEAMGMRRAKGLQDCSPQPRRCSHCLTQRTPQWRAGPSGPKSLCNACGVRFKSGRLFPEYRPAKSPTFVSYMHSNSHKKVMQMRGEAGGIQQQQHP